MTMRRPSLRNLLVAALALPATASPQNGRSAVEFGRTGYRLTALGARVAVNARVLDARRRAVPNAPIAYRTSDPDIAVVSNQGVVQSKRVGRTKVWAVSGRDSASALIVVDQWATTFAFVPPAVQFDAIGKQLALRVQLRDEVGNAIPDGGRATAQCRIRDEKVATFAPSGQVVSKGNGATFIRCTDKGISDSVRVEVRQRPARAMIADKLAIGTKQVGDTFRLRVRAVDPQGDDIADVRATWASLSPGVVNIDPLSGSARAIGGGTTRIVTQVGDVTDTVAVVVTGAAAQGAAGDLLADSLAAAGAPRQPTLRMDQIFFQVGDTAKVKFTARDALGAEIANPERDVKLITSDDKVVKVLSNQRIVALDTGNVMITAQFSAAGAIVLDSMAVSPRSRGLAGTATTATATRTAVPFERPTFAVDSQRAFNRQQIQEQMKMIVDSGIGRTTTGTALAFEALVGLANHSAKTALFSETRSGLFFGGMGLFAPIRQVVATGSFRTATLAPPADVLSEDLQVVEVEGNLMYWPASWFGVGGGYLVRGENTVSAKQSWTAASATGALRGSFVGNAVRVSVSGSIFPAATFSGRKDKPEQTSFAGESAVDLRIKFIDAGFAYYVERFSFAATGTLSERVDVFSNLRFRLGLKFGGRQ